MKLTWTKTNEYLKASTPDFKFKEKLAMFDLDSTLIVPKIGKKFPIDENDWKFNFPNVKSMLIDYANNNYSVIIISNQGGMAKGKQTFEVWSNKLNQICEKLGIELYVFCSVDHNKYRKPYPTWFNEFVPDNITKNLNRSNSFYCGDACGRKGDFSDTDYKFALNCMINFKTPESLFDGQNQKLPKINYPNISDESFPPSFVFNKLNDNKNNNANEMILMIGYQGSGKSFIANTINKNHGYIVINQDILKTKDKCKTAAKLVMSQGKSLVIDQTNPDVVARKIWIDLANEYGYVVRAILMTTSRELSKHNNYFRYLTSGIDVIPEIAYRIYASKFTAPNLNEGIVEIMEAHCDKPKNPNYELFLY